MPIANIILKLWVAGSVDRANSNWFSWVLRRCLEAEQFWRKKPACSAYCMLSIWLTDQFHNLALRWQLQRQRKCLHNWYPLIGLIKIGLPFGYLGKPKHRLVIFVFHCVFPFTRTSKAVPQCFSHGVFRLAGLKMGCTNLISLIFPIPMFTVFSSLFSISTGLS